MDAAAGPAGPEPEAGQGRWRILLADDHAMVRAGLRAVVAEDPRCEVVAEAGTLAELKARAATERPDLVLLDLTLGKDSGLEAIPHLLGAARPPKVVVLTMHDDPAFARDALGRGAQGYLLKEAAADELGRAIETVMAGGTYLHPELGARMAAGRPTPADRLTERERDVLRLLALGHTNAEIAKELYISLRTVEAHRSGLRTRLGATSRADLVEAARRLGLVT
jgi:two-component system, NarL family, response regulator NreC